MARGPYTIAPINQKKGLIRIERLTISKNDDI